MTNKKSTEKRTETHACDLISRNAVYDRVSRIVSVNHLDPEKVWFTPIGVKALIKEMPPAQPEREKGKWIQNDNGTYSCSLCHSWIPEEQHYYAQFCLYCGADMREVKVKCGDEDTLQGGLMSAT